MTCRFCRAEFPNDQIPAKVKDAVPEQTIEVRQGRMHRYPFHAMDPSRQMYPDERVYLHAKRDYECREFLSKFALYAAVRYRDHSDPKESIRYARAAAVLILRFAQVYPDYATHFDQPGHPKFLQSADLQPPFRRGYATGKWDWLGCLDVPINLVIAYALIREDPALIEAGHVLGETDPRKHIEENLFRASAEFVQRQIEEYSESSLYAYRGLLAVGRLLDDSALMHEGIERLEAFAARGFYYDGLWRQGDAVAHRRVIGQIDGWIDRLIAGYTDPPGIAPAGLSRFDTLPGAGMIAQIRLARHAAGAAISDRSLDEVILTSWPTSVTPSKSGGPRLLGGSTMARLSVGRGEDALDLELRGLGDYDTARSNRLSLRLAVGQRPVLWDLDDSNARPDGFDRASASHNTAMIDGLNHRETLDQAGVPAPGADVRFYAADTDFQVVVLEDRNAYPTMARRYRRLLIASSGVRTRFAVDVFELHGGRQHDLLYHGGPETARRWTLSVPSVPGPKSLLPPSIVYVTTAPVHGGRWFIQAYGVFSNLSQGWVDRPAQALLFGADHGLRLHLLGDFPATAYLCEEPGPAVGGRSHVDSTHRAALILRRRGENPDVPLASRFVVVHEPISSAIEPLSHVGRATSPPETIVLEVRSGEGPEYLVINTTPGTDRSVELPDGRDLTTNGLVVRVRDDGLVLAGGTYATIGGQTVRQSRLSGIIVQSSRSRDANSLGSFLTADRLAESESLQGHALVIRHGDETSHAWIVDRVEPSQAGSRIFVKEEPGFQVDPETGDAMYYQFPKTRHRGPHTYTINRMIR